MRWCAFLLLCACGGTPSAANETEEPAEANASVRNECSAIMHRTRTCADVFVPALMHLRVRLDRPPGIAARVQAEGEEAILTIAREEFERDWSEERIAANCDELVARPAEEQEAIMTPERECFRAADCEAFVACDMANKERRWTAEGAE